MNKKLIFKKPYPVYGAKINRINNTDGQFVILRQDWIDKPILNPETLTGKLLFYTTAPGYDYNHPFSGAHKRAAKVVDALNKTDEQIQAEKQVCKLYECLWEALIKDYKENDFINPTWLHAINQTSGQKLTINDVEKLLQ